MFQFFRRVRFINSNAPFYMEQYGLKIAEDHKAMIEFGWPANEFVDWYMETAGRLFEGIATYEFCNFM